MVNKKQLIDVDAAVSEFKRFAMERPGAFLSASGVADILTSFPTVDAVEVADKELREAINLLIKQYEHSKNSDYVHSPVAHAFYYTWKQLDDGRRE